MEKPLIIGYGPLGQKIISAVKENYLFIDSIFIEISEISRQETENTRSIFNIYSDRIHEFYFIIREENDIFFYNTIKTVLFNELKKIFLAKGLNKLDDFTSNFTSSIKSKEKDFFLEIIIPTVLEDTNQFSILQGVSYCNINEITGTIIFFIEGMHYKLNNQNSINVDINDIKNLYSIDDIDKDLNLIAAAEIDIRENFFLETLVKKCYESLFPKSNIEQYEIKRMILIIQAHTNELTLNTVYKTTELARIKLIEDGIFIYGFSLTEDEKKRYLMKILIVAKCNEKL